MKTQTIRKKRAKKAEVKEELVVKICVTKVMLNQESISVRKKQKKTKTDESVDKGVESCLQWALDWDCVCCNVIAYAGSD